MDWPTVVVGALSAITGTSGVVWAIGRGVKSYLETHERRTDAMLAEGSKARAQAAEHVLAMEERHRLERAAERAADRAELQAISLVFERNVIKAVEDCAKQREASDRLVSLLVSKIGISVSMLLALGLSFSLAGCDALADATRPENVASVVSRVNDPKNQEKVIEGVEKAHEFLDDRRTGK
mgnify:FL=1